MIDRLFDRINLLEKGLDATWRKNDVIANNIANADTPEFKSSSVEFESVFRDALETTAGSNAPSTPTRTSAFVENSGRNTVPSRSSLSVDSEDLSPNVKVNQDTAIRMDGNNVDMDAEMSELAKNSILYDTLSYAASRELGRLKMIINGGN